MIDPKMQLTPHFKLVEFLHNGSLEGVDEFIVENLKRLAEALEEVRELHGNRAIHVNSGFRTPAHNAAVGGAPNSYHLRGEAADIVVQGVAPKVTQELLKAWRGGLGSYSTWSHVDIGPKRRWSGP